MVWTCAVIEFIGKRMLKLKLPSRRQKMKFMDMGREDMNLVGGTEEDAEDRGRLRMMIYCGDS